MQKDFHVIIFLDLRIKQPVLVFLVFHVISIIAYQNKLGETLGRFKSPLTTRHPCALYECTYLLLRECVCEAAGQNKMEMVWKNPFSKPNFNGYLGPSLACLSNLTIWLRPRDKNKKLCMNLMYLLILKKNALCDFYLHLHN